MDVYAWTGQGVGEDGGEWGFVVEGWGGHGVSGDVGLGGWRGAFDMAAEVGGKGFVVLKPGMK